MYAWIDVTQPLRQGMPMWPGDHPFERVVSSAVGRDGSLCTVSFLVMSAHIGTHVDAPAHYLAGGATADQLDLNLLIGPAFVLDASGHRVVDVETVEGRVPAGTQRLLLKTDNARFADDDATHKGYVGLSVEAAEYLVHAGVRLIGIDYLSISGFDEPAGAHLAILGGNNTAVLEYLDLRAADEGWYDMVCLPLPVQGGDGAPARVVLKKREEP